MSWERRDAQETVVPAPLLETKLYVPSSRPRLVPRPRLVERLDRGAESALTLVSAPAGFGKTTLLAEWLAAAPADGRSAAWLSLDRRDNDPALFWAHQSTERERHDNHRPNHINHTSPDGLNQETAFVGGAFYVITFAASIPALLLIGPVLDNPDYIVSSGAESQVLWGCFLDVVNALACIGTAVALFSVVKRQHGAAHSALSPLASLKPPSSSSAL